METLQARFIEILARFKSHRIEAGLTLTSTLTCLLSLVLLLVSLNLPQQIHKKSYQEAPNITRQPSISLKPHQKSNSEEGAGELVVDIAGAVKKPGIYHLPSGSRLNDVLEKANGLSQVANHDYVAKSVNLAEVVQDQEKIYIPSLEEDTLALGSNPTRSAIVQNAADSLSESPFLNINSASKTELEDLPGIGEITAEKIIAGRPYTSVEELSKNGILKKSIFDGIKEKISI